MPYKIFWLLRYYLYRIFFGSAGKAGYLGEPKFIIGWKKIFLGNRVRIFPGARLEVHGKGKLHIGSNVSIGNDLHLACADDLRIGNGVQISSSVLITDIDHEISDINTPIFEQPLKISATQIGENCFIGAGAKILAGTKLGPACIVGANAVVRGEFEAGCIIVGIPARAIKKLNKQTGLRESQK